MGFFRFYRRTKLFGGLGINWSKSGPSLSLRTPFGSIGTKGGSIRTGITGLQYRWNNNQQSSSVPTSTSELCDTFETYRKDILYPLQLRATAADEYVGEDHNQRLKELVEELIPKTEYALELLQKIHSWGGNTRGKIGWYKNELLKLKRGLKALNAVLPNSKLEIQPSPVEESDSENDEAFIKSLEETDGIRGWHNNSSLHDDFLYDGDRVTGTWSNNHLDFDKHIIVIQYNNDFTYLYAKENTCRIEQFDPATGNYYYEGVLYNINMR